MQTPTRSTSGAADSPFQSAKKQQAARDELAFQKCSSALRERLKRSPAKRTTSKQHNASDAATVAFQDSTNHLETLCAEESKARSKDQQVQLKLRKHLVSRGHSRASVDRCETKEQLLQLLDTHPSTADGQCTNPAILPKANDVSSEEAAASRVWFAETSGLLRAVGAVAEKVSLDTLAGSVVGVDGTAWLHESLAHAAGVPLSMCRVAVVAAVLGRCNACRKAGIRVVVVFDGVMDAGRVQRRATALSEQEGCHCEEKFELMKRAAGRISHSRSLVVQLLDALTANGFPWMQAPRAASGQLAELSRAQCIDAVITNDTDCLVLGCSTVLMQAQFGLLGTAQRIRRDDLFCYVGSDQPVLEWLNQKEGVALSYLAALRSIKCHKLRGSKSLECLTESRFNVKKLADLACQLQRLSTRDKIGFCDEFNDILNMYDQQLVFEVQSKQVVSLSRRPAKRAAPLPITDTKLAVAVAGGFLNPETLVPFKECPRRVGAEVLDEALVLFEEAREHSKRQVVNK